MAGSNPGILTAVELAIFLDRDNTLIANRGDLGDAGSVRLVDGAAKALLELREAGYRLVVVTNQGGVARGKFTEADVDAVHQRIAQLLDDELHQPELIERFYYCPYHPEGTVQEYRREHSWRKPNPGMILQAGRDMELDLPHSWVIGDQPRDIAAGRAAGCHTLLLCNGREPALQTSATRTATSLAEAARLILRNGGPEPSPSVSVRVPRQVPAPSVAPTAALDTPPAPQRRTKSEPPTASEPLVTIELPSQMQTTLDNESPLPAESAVAIEVQSEPEPSFKTEPGPEPEMRAEPEPTRVSEPLVTIELPQPEPPSVETEPSVADEPAVATEEPPEPELASETELPVTDEPPVAIEVPSEPDSEPTFETEPTTLTEPIIEAEEPEASEPLPSSEAEPTLPTEQATVIEAPPEVQTSFETEPATFVEPPIAIEEPESPEPAQMPDPPEPAVSAEPVVPEFNWEVPAPLPIPEPQSTDRSLTEVRRAILELSDEVRSERIRRSDLTPAKMTAGITQLLVVLCAFFGMLQLGDPESFEAFIKWILGGALLQLVTMTLLLLDQRG